MQVGRTSEQIKAEIERVFGFLPNFFQPVFDSPEALETLWQQMLVAYVNNPLPAVFKEKLFARLSRYCPDPSCIVNHGCLMRSLGQSPNEIFCVLEGQLLLQIVTSKNHSDCWLRNPLHWPIGRCQILHWNELCYAAGGDLLECAWSGALQI
jgi:hypothetical protein